MELLSPAGNIASAYAAFKGGADAIYIGGKKFSARASADNFSDEELKEITIFAHSIGKKVYVTLNTLLFQDEFFEAVEFAKFLYLINVDGVMIQDLGLAHYLHKVMPGLQLNASTQLNCHNIEQAKALIKIGFKRIVLARECSLDLAKQIKKLGVEVEVFGHGALCVSYSGNCLLSSFIGNRSGNRGRCAQPCRMTYDLVENGETISKSSFLLSTKDLMTLEDLDKIIDAGIDSLKLEGRLKSLEYIYAVTTAYRHSIDAYQNKYTNNDLTLDKNRLIKVFNREFTKGYLLGASQFKVLNFNSSSHQGEPIGKVINVNKNRVTIKLSNNLHRLDGIRFQTKEQIGLIVEKIFLNKIETESAGKGNIIEILVSEKPKFLLNSVVIKTKDYLLNKEISVLLHKNLKVNLKGHFKAVINEPISLTLSFNNTSITAIGNCPEMAKGEGTSIDRIKEQLNKSGEYPYLINDFTYEIEKCFIPISELNSLKNEAYKMLKDKLTLAPYPKFKSYQNKTILGQIPCKSSIIVENELLFDSTLKEHFDIFTSDNENLNENRVSNKKSFNANKELLHFVIEKKNANYLIASQYCNIVNSYALDCFYNLGFDECILSSELDLESIKNLIEDYKNRHDFVPNVSMLLYGKIDMMIMRSCPIGTFYKNTANNCQRCHINNYELVDREGYKYKLLGDSSCNIRILLDKPIYLLDKEQDFKNLGINKFWFLFTDENKNDVREILTTFLNKDSKFDKKEHSRGHYIDRPL